MQEQKKYHQRKLAIIEMIEECDRCISGMESFIENVKERFVVKNSDNNIKRYGKLKQYLTYRYNRQ